MGTEKGLKDTYRQRKKERKKERRRRRKKSSVNKINKWISGVKPLFFSANEKIFLESSKIYMDALKNSGFREEFNYQKENIPNDINKENKKYNKKKIEKEKLYGLTPHFFVD